MPHDDLVSHIPYVSSVEQIIKAKKRRGVAAVALAYRLNKLGRLTEWQYVQINRRYRSAEPDGLPYEKSSVWEMVLKDLWNQGVSKNHVARDLFIPAEEIEDLLFGLTVDPSPPLRSDSKERLRLL
jgi:Zn-dependent peptidase ImmA (M78 family)